MAQRQGFELLAAVEVVRLQELRDDPGGDIQAGPAEAAGDLPEAEVGPEQVVVLGAAGGVAVEGSAEGYMDMG